MAFNPTSTIYLCNVPIDNTYQNQIRFKTVLEQQSYFRRKVVKSFAEYLTVRKTLPDGSLQSAVKVNANIDELYNCNYMFYQNEHHSQRWFFAFITKLIYVNEATTEVVFETDVYQTWMLSCEMKMSYVVREHSATDGIGDNLVPEKFNYQDYVYTNINKSNLEDWGYLLISSNICETGESIPRGTFHSGIYQGLYFYYCTDAIFLNDIIESLEKKNTDCILSIVVVPNFSVSKADINTYLSDIFPIVLKGQGYVKKTDSPASEDIDIDFSSLAFTFDGYSPTNNKLWTSPFFNLLVSNQSGKDVIYNVEDFKDRNAVKFSMYGDISTNPTVMLVPRDYKGIDKHIDYAIAITNFPQCGFNNDTFKMWLSKNSFGVAAGALSGASGLAAGAAALLSGVGGPMVALGGAVSMISGITGVLNTMNQVNSASKEANEAKVGSAHNNLLTAMKENHFVFRARMLKAEYAKTIDDFFTMYGYQTNKLKIPNVFDSNVAARPYFNYLQTVDCNIEGSIPDDDMKILKGIFNKGVTLWNPAVPVGDYAYDNRPV